ncbi:MAG: cytochrome c [Amphiplicatus sp.]
MVRNTIIGAGLILALAACSDEKGAPDGAAPLEERPAPAPDERREALSKPPVMLDMRVPEANPRRGRILFIVDGCVICHQVNGVGGTAAPRLDANVAEQAVDPLEFSARIWRGARAMTALQEQELGYVIELNGQDIADLAAFIASEDERALLTLSSVSQEMRSWFIDKPYWKDEVWDDYLEQGERIPFGEGNME